MAGGMEFTVLDMFSGAGGLTEGFVRAGFSFAAHIEMDKYAFKTLKTRFVYHALKDNGYVDMYGAFLRGEIGEDVLYSEIKDVFDSRMFINRKITETNQYYMARRIKDISGLKKVSVVIGGPPCQTFSHISRYRRNGDRFYSDERTYLFKRYLYFIHTFSPDIFVFENVTGMKTAGDGKIFSTFVKMAERKGYEVQAKVLNARNFMVLQNRRRLFVIGWKKEHRLEYPEFEPVQHPYRVWDLLVDLPPLEPGEGTDEWQQYAGNPTEYLVKANIRKPGDVLRHHAARPHNRRDREIYRIAIKKWNEERRRLRYADLPRRLKTHKNEEHFADRFKVVAGDLPYSQTVTAHLAKDGHYYIHPDIRQARSITVREAARLQSFPDDYFFHGPRGSKFVQIGNAVPPLMGERIALKIRKMLEDL